MKNRQGTSAIEALQSAGLRKAKDVPKKVFRREVERELTDEVKKR